MQNVVSGLASLRVNGFFKTRILAYSLTGILCLFLFSGCAHLIERPVFKASPASPDALWYRGAYHVHTNYSSDSKATLRDVIQTGRKAGLDFVVITDHNNRRGQEEYAAMAKQPGDPLLVFGMEISAPDGHVVGLGIQDIERPAEPLNSQQIIDRIHEQGGYAMLAHAVPGPGEKNPWKNWDVKGYDGFEIFDFAHAFYPADKVELAVTSFLTPRLFLRSFLTPPHTAISFWNNQLKDRKVSAVMSADAHLHFKTLGVDPENFLMAFQASTIFVPADEFSEKTVIQGIGKGRSFMAFEVFGSVKGFSWGMTSSGSGASAQIGDTVKLNKGLRSAVKLPEAADIRLMKLGVVVSRQQGMELIYDITEPGVYRTEVYRKDKLWIITNPIYVE